MIIPASQDNAVLANRVSLVSAVAQSKSKNLLALFGGALGSDHDEPEDAVLEKELEDLDVYGNELGGVGHVAPKEREEQSERTRGLDADTEKLRVQMLGKRAKTSNSSHRQEKRLSASKPRPRPTRRKSESDDEASGRSGVGKKRKAAPTKESQNTEQVKTDNEAEEERADTPARRVAHAPKATPISKSGGSYLDHVLAERAAKRKRKA